MKAFWMKVAVTACVIVTLSILQGQKLAWIIDALIIKKVSIVEQIGVVAFLGIVILLKNLSSFVYEHFNRLCGIKVKEQLRERLVNQIIQRGPIALKEEASGSLSSVVQTGVDQLEPYYSEFIPQMVMVMASTPLVFATVMWVDWISGLILLVTVPFIPVFMVLIGKMASNVNQEQWKKLQQMNGHFLDVLRGLPTLRLFGRVKRQAEIVAEVNETFRESTLKVLRISFLSALVLELVATLSTAVVSVSLGIRLIYGQMDFYSAFFILLMAPEYYQPIRQLGAKFHAAMGSRAAADTVFGYLDEENNCDECRNSADTSLNVQTDDPIINQTVDPTVNQTINQTINPTVDHTEPITLSVKSLSFAYNSHSQALNKVTMTVPSRNKIAMVGPSGGGKSTLVAILLGFIQDYTGTIHINEQSKDEFDTTSWSRLFAYVPQNPKLFKASLWDNLVFANPHIDAKKVQEVVEKLGLTAWISQLPKGYETYIGEGGVALSGGQTQLIAIARALIKNAPILLMDEPTSALDSQTEERIRFVLDEELKDKSVIIIAHRIPTIQSADCIYYLDQGRILEQGSHDDLMSQQGSYYESIRTWGGDI